MNGCMFSSISSLRHALVWILATCACDAGITVTDQKGRAIEIELISVTDGSVTFRRADSPKEYTLPFDNFAAESQDLIRKEASKIPAVMPKAQADVVIGKRRQKGDSYYMVKQEITSTVKLTNPSLTTPIPPISGKIIYIGQDRRSPDLYNILSTQSVEASVKPGETFTKEMEPFITSYDSDNKGSGNVGGSQYMGYVLVLTDEAGKVVVDKTTSGPFSKAISNKPGILKELITYPAGKLLTDKLEPAPVAGNGVLIR